MLSILKPTIDYKTTHMYMYIPQHTLTSDGSLQESYDTWKDFQLVDVETGDTNECYKNIHINNGQWIT